MRAFLGRSFWVLWSVDFMMNVYVGCLLKELHAGHAWHSLIYEEQGYCLIAELQLLCGFECRNSRIGGNDPITIAIMATEIALYRPQHVWIVVHRPNDWL